MVDWVGVGERVLKEVDKRAASAPKPADGKSAAAGTYTVEAGVKDDSGLVAGIEKYMQAHGLKTKENGTLSGEEAAAFKKHVASLEKDSTLPKGAVIFGKDGKITFTEKALGLLEIEVPKGGNSVAGQVAGVVDDAAKTAQEKLDKAKKAGSDALETVGGFFKRLGDNIPSAATDCGPPKDGDFGAPQPCPAKPAAPATGRSR